MSAVSIPAPERLLTRDEAAAILGVSRQTLNQWASTNRVRLPFVRVGKFARYRASDLQRFIDANVVNSVESDSQ